MRSASCPSCLSASPTANCTPKSSSLTRSLWQMLPTATRYSTRSRRIAARLSSSRADRQCPEHQTIKEHDMDSQITSRPLAVVTGASSGIGRELAVLCAQNGYDLVIAADGGPLGEV